MKEIKDLKVAAVITVYDDWELAIQSIVNIKQVFPSAVISIVHSDDGSSPKIECDSYIKLPNLQGSFPNSAVPALSICRNYSVGFKRLAELKIEADLVIAFTGDTLITDANSFYRRYSEMQTRKWQAMVAQPIGQAQNGTTDTDPPQLILEGRFQGADSTDFICCLFFVDGDFIKSGVFQEIRAVNWFTSEQCLGDHMRGFLDRPFAQSVGRLNANNPGDCYSYLDGVRWHARNGKPGR